MKAPRTGVNRRDLLRLRRNKVPRTGFQHGSDGDVGRYDLIRAHRPAMGSYFEVRLPAGTPGAVDLACRGSGLDRTRWKPS